MDVKHIEKFVRGLGCREISFGNGWVRCTCPADYLHKGGKDRKPSFAIRVVPGGESRCRCQACGVHGSLTHLLWKLEADRGVSKPELLQLLMEHNQIDAEAILDAPVHHERKDAQKRQYVPRISRKSNFVHPDDEPQTVVPEEYLGRMRPIPDHVMTYLHVSRGLEDKAIDKWELGWAESEGRVAIPIRDEAGKLVSISGRLLDEAKCRCGGVMEADSDGKKRCPACNRRPSPKYLHSSFKRDRVLYGEHLHDPAVRKGYLFEGFFQTIYSWQCEYVNTLARMGTHLSTQQASKLVRWFDHLVIVPDGDKPGRDAAEKDAQTLEMLKVEGRPFDDPGAASGDTLKISKIEIADMPDDMDADRLDPDKLRDLLGPTNSA